MRSEGVCFERRVQNCAKSTSNTSQLLVIGIICDLINKYISLENMSDTDGLLLMLNVCELYISLLSYDKK